MLTTDKKITTPAYWDKVYSGKNMNAKVDSSNTKRPDKAFDRFEIVVNQVLKTDARPGQILNVLDIGSGHAHICKRISAKFRPSLVVASDQTEEAKKVAKYEPYFIFSGYKIPYPDKFFDVVICTQAMEYMEIPDMFLLEASRVGRKFICTVPDGEMGSWSQLRIYNQSNLKEFLSVYGKIEHFESRPGLLLAKIKFHET